MSWRLPCPPGKAEERMEAGGKQAASTGAARRRRSKGGPVVETGIPYEMLTPLIISGIQFEGFSWHLAARSHILFLRPQMYSPSSTTQHKDHGK